MNFDLVEDEWNQIIASVRYHRGISINESFDNIFNNQIESETKTRLNRNKKHSMIDKTDTQEK